MFTIWIATAAKEWTVPAAFYDERFSTVGALFVSVFFLEVFFFTDWFGVLTVRVISAGFEFSESTEFDDEVMFAVWAGFARFLLSESLFVEFFFFEFDLLVEWFVEISNNWLPFLFAGSDGI